MMPSLKRAHIGTRVWFEPSGFFDIMNVWQHFSVQIVAKECVIVVTIIFLRIIDLVNEIKSIFEK